MSRLWKQTEEYSGAIRDSLRFLLLSYNAAHSTLMTRVVVKQKSPDFVITGAQSGVLYVSSLPVEKNIFEGIRRKIGVLKQAFQLVGGSRSTVRVYNKSSTTLAVRSRSVDYVFTDPPFGDYIPYSELNQINEAWLGQLTGRSDEVVVNQSQGKGIPEYGHLMSEVLRGVSRSLKNDGQMSLVFHSASAGVWKALVEAYRGNKLKVINSSILDKVQTSFKQTNSVIKVQGDPILLLEKEDLRSHKPVPQKKSADSTTQVMIRRIIRKAYAPAKDPSEKSPERMYSRYVNACLESGKHVAYDAGEFYALLQHELPKMNAGISR
jgi:hypothetical protein